MKNCLLAIFVAVMCDTVFSAPYIRENQYDTTTHPDDAAANISLVSNRWPDCSTLETTIDSIFRIEGVADRGWTSDQDRAMALWKWFRIMVSATGGASAFEQADPRRLVYDAHKILTVYGHHQCDGQSWAMVPLWRAAGYMAFDECHNGHTIAALRYRDADGQERYHNFDPQSRFYYWDEDRDRVGCWSMPVFTGHVFRHLTAPLKVHTMRTSLRLGETIERNWANTGHVVPFQQGGKDIMPEYYGYTPGRTDGTYSVSGEEVQTLVIDTTPAVFNRQLAEGSSKTKQSASAGRLQPGEGGKADFLFRLPSPFVAVDGLIEARLTTGRPDDLCRFQISCDGGEWRTIHEKSAVGTETMKLEIGRPAREKNRPHIYTAYEVRLRVQLQTTGDPGSVRVEGLKATIWRQLNKRTLPNLMPGRNVFRVNADSLPDGQALKLTMRYRRNVTPDAPEGEQIEKVFQIAKTPYYFSIDEDFALRKITNYDRNFNNEAVRMVGYSMQLVPATAQPGEGLPAAEAQALFARAYPHPADMTNRKARKGAQVESDIIQTNGFVPQSRVVSNDITAMNDLIARIPTTQDFTRFTLIQQLGDFPNPQARDFLLGLLGESDIDETIYVVKALAQIGDPKAVDPLLAKWNAGMKGILAGASVESTENGAPGSRYIPDALAAIVAAGEKSNMPAGEIGSIRQKSVAALLAPLPKLRFDFRFHIAHALGTLGKGNPAAVAALRDLAANDPFPPVRQEAQTALAKLGEK